LTFSAIHPSSEKPNVQKLRIKIISFQIRSTMRQNACPDSSKSAGVVFIERNVWSTHLTSELFTDFGAGTQPINGEVLTAKAGEL
jgi:hypothetical protein